MPNFSYETPFKSFAFSLFSISSSKITCFFKANNDKQGKSTTQSSHIPNVPKIQVLLLSTTNNESSSFFAKFNVSNSASFQIRCNRSLIRHDKTMHCFISFKIINNKFRQKLSLLISKLKKHKQFG